MRTVVLVSAFLFVICAAQPAHAYIGPGAGFAVAGSFLVIFAAIASALIILITWPVRALVRALKFRKVYERSRIKRAVVLGFDGMDFALTSKMIEQGKLPNFARLRERGCFKPLRSTIPPISPVAWSSFQTGVNPGKHNIFDFLTRDPQTYAPRLSSSEIRGPARSLRLGKYTIPIGRPDIRLLRKAVPFWKLLGDNGIFSSIIRVPITFPPEKFHGVQLSGMCAPDLRGSQGIFSYFTTAAPAEGDSTGGEVTRVVRNGSTITSALQGPDDPLLSERVPLTCAFMVFLKAPKQAELRIGSARHTLTIGEYSPWIAVEFRASLGRRISGICRFLLQEIEPEFRLYVTPIQIDPAKPAMPVSHPPIYSTYLAKNQGRYATLGLAEDSWALNNRCLDDAGFLEQCRTYDSEREIMFFDALEKTGRGLCVCVFDGTDRVQHSFWRELDPEHPAHLGSYTTPEVSAIEAAYMNADRIVGRTLESCGDDETLVMVISDHGFNTFRYGVDLNRWLEENGYLVLKEQGRGVKNLAGIDWSRTRAFAVGLAGIYINLKGRESGGIVEPGQEAADLRAEIAEKLSGLTDPQRGNQSVVKKVYNALATYAGPYKQDAPDLLVGFYIGYRASWETAVGQVTDCVFHDNLKAWSGDHCVDQSLVPGVLFCNRSVEEAVPRLLDIGPTLMQQFGVDVPAYMDGRPWSVGPAAKATERR
jgi:predicted AlkP superfamily phosphohydrolase/phosphomutase